MLYIYTIIKHLNYFKERYYATLLHSLDIKAFEQNILIDM